MGRIGQWLLDPTVIRITTGGGGVIPSGCPTGATTISPATIEGQPTTVNLCAGIIIQEEPLVMSNPGVGLSFTAPAGDSGIFMLEGSITTQGGAVTLSNLATVVLQSVIIDTTNSGGTPSGADITFEDVDTDGGGESISFIAGTVGIVTLGELGIVDRFGSVTIQAEEAIIHSIFTDNSPITISCPTTLQGNSALSTVVTGGGANITLQTVDASSVGAESLTVNAGFVGTITVGNIGSTTALGTVSIVNALEAYMSDITTQNGSIDIKAPVLLSQSLTTWQILKNSNNSSMVLNTINGTTLNGQSLSLITEKRGSITLAATGVTMPLNNLSIYGDAGILLSIVEASSMTIQGRSATVFTRDMFLSGAEGLDVRGFSITLNGHFFAEKVTLESFASILSVSNLQLITVTTGALFMNSIIGDIGTLTQPVFVNAIKPITIGANLLASLRGFPEHAASTIRYVADNTPCVVIFNTNTILNCNLPSRERQRQLSHGFLFRSTSFSASRLGIGYNLLPYQNHKIRSDFGDIFSISEELGGSSYYRFMGL